MEETIESLREKLRTALPDGSAVLVIQESEDGGLGMSIDFSGEAMDAESTPHQLACIAAEHVQKAMDPGANILDNIVAVTE